jgi:BRCA1-associated protein
LNKCLTSNQEIYQTKLNNLEESFKKSNQEKEKEIQELQLQLRDIMFYLDAQNKMSESKEVTQEEIQNSQLVINNTENEAGGASGVTATPSSKLASRRKRK